jgi:hypothetical protein
MVIEQGMKGITPPYDHASVTPHLLVTVTFSTSTVVGDKSLIDPGEGF